MYSLPWYGICTLSCRDGSTLFPPEWPCMKIMQRMDISTSGWSWQKKSNYFLHPIAPSFSRGWLKKCHLCLSTPSNSLCEAIEMKARSPDKFMVVTSDVKVTDEDALLSRRMMIKAKNIIMKDWIWIKAVHTETEFSREPYQQDVTSVKRSGTWLNMESKNLAPKCLASRCVPNKPIEFPSTVLGWLHWRHALEQRTGRKLESSDDSWCWRYVLSRSTEKGGSHVERVMTKSDISCHICTIATSFSVFQKAPSRVCQRSCWWTSSNESRPSAQNRSWFQFPNGQHVLWASLHILGRFIYWLE